MKLLAITLGIILFFATSLVVTSCQKHTRNATVVRDCTGTYIQLGIKEHLVVNPETLASFSDDAEIRVEYEKASQSDVDNGIVCELYHPFDDYVRVIEVK